MTEKEYEEEMLLLEHKIDFTIQQIEYKIKDRKWIDKDLEYLKGFVGRYNKLIIVFLQMGNADRR